MAPARPVSTSRSGWISRSSINRSPATPVASQRPCRRSSTLATPSPSPTCKRPFCWCPSPRSSSSWRTARTHKRSARPPRLSRRPDHPVSPRAGQRPRRPVRDRLLACASLLRPPCLRGSVNDGDERSGAPRFRVRRRSPGAARDRRFGARKSASKLARRPGGGARRPRCLRFRLWGWMGRLFVLAAWLVSGGRRRM